MIARCRITWARWRAAQASYRAARGALDDNAAAEVAAGIDYETPTFDRLNSEFWAAYRAAPWWVRW